MSDCWKKLTVQLRSIKCLCTSMTLMFSGSLNEFDVYLSIYRQDKLDKY